MKRRPFLLTSGFLSLSLALLFAAGCAGGGASSPVMPAGAIPGAADPSTAPALMTTASPGATMIPAITTTVVVVSSSAYGSYLATPTGLALYTYSGDSPGKSTVSGSLLGLWPPFTASGTLTLPTGVGGKLTQITRPDGSKQVAYNDMPLYTFVQDTPGHVTGQGVAGFKLATVSVSATGTPATGTAATGTPVTMTPATATVTTSGAAAATPTPAGTSPY